MTETAAINACHEKDFISRVTFSLSKNAHTFLTDAAPANVTLAKLVRDNPDTYALRFAVMALASLTAGALAAITDFNSIAQSTIDSQVVALWPSFAL